MNMPIYNIRIHIIHIICIHPCIQNFEMTSVFELTCWICKTFILLSFCALGIPWPCCRCFRSWMFWRLWWRLSRCDGAIVWKVLDSLDGSNFRQLGDGWRSEMLRTSPGRHSLSWNAMLRRAKSVDPASWYEASWHWCHADSCGLTQVWPGQRLKIYLWQKVMAMQAATAVELKMSFKTFHQVSFLPVFRVPLTAGAVGPARSVFFVTFSRRWKPSHPSDPKRWKRSQWSLKTDYI